MIYHQSPYGQILKFSPELYYSLSDEKLLEIEQNCANINKESVTISSGLSIEESDEEKNPDL